MTRTLASEPSIPLAKGTADWLPDDHARLLGLESSMLRRFSLAGYDRLNTPVLEPVELHERKSGAGIVGKLFELNGRLCLRPELTAGIVRAYTAAEPMPPLPWRVSHAGPAFRKESPSRADRLREFRQVGIERLGDSGVFADAEVISLAWSSVEGVGVEGATLRLGHVGLTLEMLGRSGLPPAAQAALVEMLSEAAAEGGTSARSAGGSTTSPSGSARLRAVMIFPCRSTAATTAGSTACSARSSRSSTAGGPATKSSSGSGGNGIWGTPGSRPSTASATRPAPSPT